MKKFSLKAFAVAATIAASTLGLAACSQDAQVAQQTLATETAPNVTAAPETQAQGDAVQVNLVGPAAGNPNLGVVFIPETGQFIMPGPSNQWAANYIDHYIPYEELVRRAMEEGAVNWATSGSRGPEAAAEFEALYPGISVNILNIGSGDVLERFPREHAAGIREIDVIRMADSEGVIYREFLANGLFHNYFPYDIVPHVYDPSFLRTGMPSYVSLNIIYYNYTMFPEGSPISSWWDLTLPEWYGRIIAQNPIVNPRYLSQFTTFLLYADEFAAEYERIFGRPIELSPNAPTAAHEWAIRFFANDPIWDSSGSSMNRTIGSPSQTQVFLGWGSSSGIRRNYEEGLHLAFANMTPALSQPNMNYVFIADGAPNPHAAMLLARYLVGGQGETLGLGTVDRNLEGSWLTRRDIPRHPNAPAALDELTLFVHDGEFVYYNSPAMFDFLITLQ